MIRKGLMILAASGIMAVSALAADVVVRIAPPRTRVERRLPAPGRGYVWTPGYNRWDGRAYIWSPGVWVRPPRAHAHWVPPRWVKHGHEWRFVEGHWR